MKDIVVFGAGGFGREVIWTLEDINSDKREWNILGFIDDDREKWGKCINGYEVFSPEAILNKYRKCHISNGIGNCFSKYILSKRFTCNELEYANLVHPATIVNRTAKLDGVGIVIQAGSIIAPNVIIKSHVTINLDVTIGHDCILNKYTTVAPGVHLSGYVNIGYGSDIGTGASVIQGLTIGHECIIGANAAVINNIDSNSVAVGVPAKKIKSTEQKIIF